MKNEIKKALEKALAEKTAVNYARGRANRLINVRIADGGMMTEAMLIDLLDAAGIQVAWVEKKAKNADSNSNNSDFKIMLPKGGAK